MNDFIEAVATFGISLAAPLIVAVVDVFATTGAEEEAMTYTDLGEAATAALVTAAERWPELREIQAILAPVVADYQRKKVVIADAGDLFSIDG